MKQSIAELLDRIADGRMSYDPAYKPEKVLDCGLYAVEITGETKRCVRAVWLKFGSVFPVLEPGWYVKRGKK